jgi:hypothetical protein
MARKPVEYFSCAKCGYRGIVEQHDCIERRSAIAESAAERMDRRRQLRHEQMEQIAEIEPVIRAAVADQVERVTDPTEKPGEPQAARLQRDLTQMLDRYVGVTYTYRHTDSGITVTSDGDNGVGVYNLHQRCDACREVFTTENVRGDRGYFATGVIVARAVRLAWLKHRCKPVGGELANLDTEDLRELYEQLEVESGRLAQRAIDVKRVLDERFAKERS